MRKKNRQFFSAAATCKEKNKDTQIYSQKLTSIVTTNSKGIKCRRPTLNPYFKEYVAQIPSEKLCSKKSIKCNKIILPEKIIFTNFILHVKK